MKLLFFKFYTKIENMKKDIHPKYHDKSTVKCVCGNSFEVGSTQEEIQVEICSHCHPFYTGKEKMIDTAGRVEKFKQRVAKKQELTKKSKKAK
jgi:large subunit ribosomal protein L31